MIIPRIDHRALPGLFLISVPLLAVVFFTHSFFGSLFFIILLIAHLCFFRDMRVPIADGPEPVSPASGKVTDIERVEETLFLKQKALRIGIFLSVFDSHITAAPLAGEVAFIRYVPGKFENALDGRRCSQVNESNWIGIHSKASQYVVRQISGAIARRIHCDVKEKQTVQRTQKIGIICYGSRVEIFFPDGVFEPAIKIGDRVQAGVTLLGHFTA